MDIFCRVMMREWRNLCSHRWLMLCVIAYPLIGALFFTTMLQEGLPDSIPIAVIDADNSAMSRGFIDNLATQQSIDIVMRCTEYNEARDAMQRNKIYGFVYIPERFEQAVWDGKQPTISFYTNDAFLIPGSLLYKSFMTMTLLASASVVQDVLLSVDITPARVETLLQPIVIDMHPLGNPWINYSVYLSNSFLPSILQLMILLTTVYVVGSEWKHRTIGDWVAAAQGNVPVAIVGKLSLYTLLFVAEGLLVLLLLYGWLHFPFHTEVWSMILAIFLLVVSAQSLSLVILSVAPNLQFAFSAASVVGVVSFSLGGFSFPVAAMYAPFWPLSYLLPVRHYFLIYVNNALNGYPLYYCRGEYIALLCFVLVALLSMPRLVRIINRYQGGEL